MSVLYTQPACEADLQFPGRKLITTEIDGLQANDLQIRTYSMGRRLFQRVG